MTGFWKLETVNKCTLRSTSLQVEGILFSTFTLDLYNGSESVKSHEISHLAGALTGSHLGSFHPLLTHYSMFGHL